MGSLIKVAASRLPRCVISPRTLVATHHQRCFFSTTTTNDRHGFKNNLYRVRNVALNNISSFVYENIINRFGLFDKRVFHIYVKNIEPLEPVEEDACLIVAVPMKGVISHEQVRVKVDHNAFKIQGVVYDEFKATYEKYESKFWLPEEDYYSNFKMRDIQAHLFFTEKHGDVVALYIPKFNEDERMMNQKKHEAGEFSKLKEDAFIFDIKVIGDI